MKKIGNDYAVKITGRLFVEMADVDLDALQGEDEDEASTRARSIKTVQTMAKFCAYGIRSQDGRLVGDAEHWMNEETFEDLEACADAVIEALQAEKQLAEDAAGN